MESSPYWEEGAHPDFLLSVNDRMLLVREVLLAAAQTEAPVTLCGEKGLGKEALALTVHRWSPRTAGPFVRVNCHAVASAQLSAELFGHARNGSLADSATAFTRARGGTLHLGGVETLSPELCEKLGSTLARLEGEPPDQVPRIVLSTVLSTEAVEPQGALRSLLDSLPGNGSGVTVRLPPLRERPEDIGLLAQHLLQLYSPFYSSRIKQVRSSLVELFRQYPWPGNVRELERVIRRFLVLEDESAIRRELEEKIWQGNGRTAAQAEEFPPGLKLGEIGKLAARRAEARVIRRVLEQTRWNKKAAARELGVSYKSLLNKVRDYGLDS